MNNRERKKNKRGESERDNEIEGMRGKVLICGRIEQLCEKLRI